MINSLIDIPDSSKLCDTRKKKDLNKYTYSKYLRKDVIKNLKTCIIDSKIEESCYWGAELISSGFIWELMIELSYIACKHINIYNPYISKYIYIENSFLLNIVQLYGRNKLLDLRNNQSIRNHFCEFICILALSKKNEIPNIPTYKNKDLNNTFDILLKKIDEKILYISTKDTVLLISKLLNFAKYINVYEKIWDIIKKKLNTIPIQKGKNINYLYKTFKNFNTKKKNLNNSLLLFAISIMKNTVKNSENFIKNKKLIQACINVNILYKKIKDDFIKHPNN